MSSDLIFVIGLALAGLAVISLLAAHVEQRWPRMAAVLGVLSVGSIGYAEVRSDDGYSVTQIPHAVVRLIADFRH